MLKRLLFSIGFIVCCNFSAAAQQQPTPFLVDQGNGTTGDGMIWQQGSNVGIGTNAPGQALSVVGNIQASGNLMEKSVTFTPTAPGWYRILSNAGGVIGGVIRIFGYFDNRNTDVEFQFDIAAYSLPGSIQQTRYASYNYGNVTQVRISGDGNATMYLDIYVNSADRPGPLTVYGYGPWMPNFVLTPVVGATAGISSVNVLQLGPGFNTTSVVNAGTVHMGNDGITFPDGNTQTSGLRSVVQGSNPSMNPYGNLQFGNASYPNGVLNFWNNGDNGWLPIISTTRGDNSQQATLSYDGWKSYAFNFDLGIGVPPTMPVGTIQETLYVNGNAGIGTASAQATLDVNGTLRVATLSANNSGPICTGPNSILTNSGCSGSSGSGGAISQSNGNVGIGTQTPGSLFSLYSTAPSSYSSPNPVMSITSTNGGNANSASALDFNTYATAGAGTGNPPSARLTAVDDNYAADLVFSSKVQGGPNNPLRENMRILGNGYVGIGTANPLNTLQVEGNLHMDGHPIYLRSSGGGDQYDFLQWGQSSGGSGNDGVDVAGYNGVTLGYSAGSGGHGVVPVLSVRASGNVGIGTASPGSGIALDVVGNIRASAGIMDSGLSSSNIPLCVGPGGLLTNMNTNCGGGASGLPSDVVYTDHAGSQTVNEQTSFMNYVGIGTNAPQSQLHVLGSDWNGITLTSSVDSHTIGTLKNDPLGNYVSGKRFFILSDETPNSDGSNGGIMLRTNSSASYGGGSPAMVLRETGNVGIGTVQPGTDLPAALQSGKPIFEVAGTIALGQNSGGSVVYQDGTVQSTAWNGTLSGGDYAESIDVVGDREEYEPGDVIAIDDSDSGKFVKSGKAYSRMVAGVYSTKPGLVGRRATAARIDKDAEVPMAMMGIVPVKVTTENGPIERGDLLVSSGTPGYAMKGTDRDLLSGAVLGKALAPLKSGSGIIEVLLSLQ